MQLVRIYKWFRPLIFFARAHLSPFLPGVVAVVEADGKVVLVRHSYIDGWLLPGGGVKGGEHPRAAVLRELREEIGLTASAPPEFVGMTVKRRGLITSLVVLYRVRDAEFSFRPNLEIRELRLVDPLALPPEIPPIARWGIRAAQSGPSPRPAA